LIAAEITGRSCIGSELNPQYVDVGILRWQNFTGQKAVLEATGQTYDETKAGFPRSQSRIAQTWRSRPMANHRHKPTPEQRALVESLAGIGVTHKQICAIMRLGADTLIKYYTDELVLGDAKATAKVAQSLFQ